jgi:hypothetical protein
MTVPHVMDSSKPHYIELVWLKETGSMGEAKKVQRGRPDRFFLARPPGTVQG